jgi:hypothetical protein
MNNGFIDLRQNDGKLVDDSFWPSFTDIMTVIVMIFLIATTVLIVKNWELVRELEQRILNEKDISAALKVTIVEKNKTHNDLLASIEAKNQISLELEASIVALQKTNEIAEQNQAQNITLEQQLNQAGIKQKLLKLQLLKAKEKSALDQNELNNKTRSIESKHQQITNLKEIKSDLEIQLKQLLASIEKKNQFLDTRTEEIKRLDSLLQQSRNRTASTQQKLDISNTETQIAKQQLNKAQQLMGEKQLEIQKHLTNIKAWEKKFTDINQLNNDKQQQIKSLQDQIVLAQQQQIKKAKTYEQLQEKYRKLIRPARSTLGKYVVEVRYTRFAGKVKVSIKTASDEKYNQVDVTEVHKKLEKLKQQYGKRLYVKVIIPDNSGLSYNEAWEFMQNIFSKYDYYYQ